MLILRKNGVRIIFYAIQLLEKNNSDPIFSGIFFKAAVYGVIISEA